MRNSGQDRIANRMLRTMVGPQKKRVIDALEELIRRGDAMCVVFSDIVASRGERDVRNADKTLVGNRKARYYLADPGVDGCHGVYSASNRNWY